MHPAYSVILFTTASGAGYGLLALLCLVGISHGEASSLAFGLTSMFVSLGLITIGLLVIQYFLGFVTVIWGDSFAGAPIFHYISSQQHLHYFASGLIDTRPIVYFLSVPLFVLFLTYQVVDYRRWKR